MHIHYDAEADVLLLRVRDLAPVDAIEEPGGVIVSYGEDGEPVSVEFLHAARRRLLPADATTVSVATSVRRRAG